MATHVTVVLILLSLWRAEAAKVPAIYVFGDSTADVGNNNYIPGGNPTSHSNHPYYGIDYPGGKPTGRFSNGYNSVDFLAKKLGFKESPPPALSTTDAKQELVGVNYASGGSGIFDATGQNISFTMNEQITYFEKTVQRLIGEKGTAAAHLFLSKSLFIFSTSNNDMFVFYRSFGPQNSTRNEQFISLLTDTFKDQLKKLYDLGARKFAVFGSMLVGCPPIMRSLTPSGGCNKDLNDLARRFDTAMKEKLKKLSSTSAGMKYSFASISDITSTVLAHPLRFGFKEMKSACCGSGLLNAATMCLPNSTYCANRNEYWSWDFVHQTQAANKLIAKFAFGTHSFVGPINFRQLARI